MKKLRIIKTLVAVAGLLLVAACVQRQDHVTLKLAHTLDTTHPVHQAMVYMDERLQVLSGGTMSFDIYPSGQLGSERDLIELLQIGSLAMTKVSTSPMESFLADMKVFSLPYVFRGKEHLWNVLEGEIGQSLLLAGESVHLRGLVYYDAGSRSFYTREKAVRTPADLAGLKIRVQNSATSVQMVNTLGGSATPISFGELYTALQQGVVDGAENNPPSFYLSRHYDVARYYTLDMHTSVPDILLMSSHIWNRLTQEQQGWLQEAARQSVPYQKKLWKQSSDAALKAVVEAGVTVIEPDKATFQAAVKDMHEGYRGQPAYELLQRISAVQGN